MSKWHGPYGVGADPEPPPVRDCSEFVYHSAAGLGFPPWQVNAWSRYALIPGLNYDLPMFSADRGGIEFHDAPFAGEKRRSWIRRVFGRRR